MIFIEFSIYTKGEFYMHYLDIQYIINNNFKKLSLSMQYEYLHFRINQLLNSIINLNVLNKKSKIFVNFIKNKNDLKISTRSINSLKYLIEILTQVSKKNYSFNLNIFTLKGYINLCLEIHKIILDYLYKYINTKSYVIHPKRYNSRLYTQFPEVQSFCKEILTIEGVKEAFIQGSLSTLDYTKFSDFDTFIVISKETEENIDLFIDTIFKLFRISSYFYRFDPYQHHRYFACLESDLYAYNQTFLPSKVLDYATSIKGTEKLTLRVYSSKLSHIIFLINSLDYFSVHHKEGFERIANLWNLKYFIATVFFIPVLFLEAKNIYAYKRDSFSMIKDILPINLQKYLDRCSYLRQTWDYKLTVKENFFRKLFLDIYSNPILYEYVMQKYGQKINKEEFNFVFSGSISYARFFYSEVKKALIEEFNINVE